MNAWTKRSVDVIIEIFSNLSEHVNESAAADAKIASLRAWADVCVTGSGTKSTNRELKSLSCHR